MMEASFLLRLPVENDIHKAAVGAGKFSCAIGSRQLAQSGPLGPAARSENIFVSSVKRCSILA
jgi:hypothetical protein